MAEVVTQQAQTDTQSRFWGFAGFWGLHAWIFAYSFVMLSAFYIQFVEGEFPVRYACCSATG